MPNESIYSESEARMAENMVRIIYCNPFDQERQMLNREGLGNQFVKTRWKTDQILEEGPNLERLQHFCEALLRTGRTMVTRLKNPKAHPQFHLHEHLVYFYLYHNLASSMDAFITNCIQQPTKNFPWNYYKDLESGYDHYLSSVNKKLKPDYSKSELASFLFQIRRAF